MATMFGERLQALARSVGRVPDRWSNHRFSASPTSPPASSINLDTLIQAEIIPRLLIAHPATPTPPPTSQSHGIRSVEAQRFAPLALTLEADELLAEVETFIARGVPVQSIFVDLLAPSARRLGQLWDEDACDFVDVTMGLWRLQEVMREIAIRMPTVTDVLTEPRSALFSPMPGEQHSFGVLMVEEVFTLAGWRSEALIAPGRQELLRVLAICSYDVVGLTVSCECSSGALPELITAIRSVSKNPAIQVLVGGQAVNADPSLAATAGADGTAPDASSALALAEAKVPCSRLLERPS